MSRPASLPAGNTGHAFWSALTLAYTFHATGQSGSGVSNIKTPGTLDGTIAGSATRDDTEGLVDASSGGKVTFSSVTSSNAVSYMFRAKLTAANNNSMIFGKGAGSGYFWLRSGANTAQYSAGAGGSSVNYTVADSLKTSFHDYCLVVEAESGSLHAQKLYRKAVGDTTWTFVSSGNDTGLSDRIVSDVGEGYTAGGGLGLIGSLEYFYIFQDTALTQSNLDTDFADPYDIVVSAPANEAPTASSVSISGTTTEGQTLTGNYTYGDTESDVEGTSTFRWLRDNVAISGATSSTYLLDAADVGTMIKFEVTPVAVTGTSPGTAVQSTAVGPIVTASATITLTQQNRADIVKLKKGSGTFSWTLAGTYTGTPTSIEWRFGGSGSWTVGVASPTGGTFSFSAAVDGTVAAQGFEVRFSNDTGVVDTDDYVTVCDDVYILEVDSIADGRLTNAKVHTGRTYTLLATNSSGTNWQPVDDAIMVASNGSHWPILADRLADDRIACFIPSGSSGQALTGLRASDVTTVINNTKTTGSSTGAITGVLMHGGANDAADAGTETDSAANWQAEVEAMANSFATAYTGCKVYLAILGDVQSLTSVDARATAIRQGFIQAIANNANCRMGANVWWRELTSDHLHPVTDQEGTDYANEWWFSIRTGATTRPVVVSAAHNLAKTQVTIAFDSTLRTGTSLSTNCFEVKDDGTPVSVSSASVSGSTVVLTLASAASGTITVSMGANEGPYGTPPQGTAVSLPDSGGNFYPAAQPFFALAVSAPTSFNPAWARNSNVLIGI